MVALPNNNRISPIHSVQDIKVTHNSALNTNISALNTNNISEEISNKISEEISKKISKRPNSTYSPNTNIKIQQDSNFTVETLLKRMDERMSMDSTITNDNRMSIDSTITTDNIDILINRMQLRGSIESANIFSD